MNGEDRRPAGEFELIDRIREILPGDLPAELVVGPGDDCAAIRARDGRLVLVTVDTLVEDRHFLRTETTAAALGERLAAVNASDIAAMGGTPCWGVLSMVLPGDLARGWSRGVAARVAAGLGRHGAHLVGGNLSASPATVVLDLTLLGEVAPERVLRRAGARPGDRVLVTGRLGAAAAGRAILDARLTLDPATQGDLLRAVRRPVARVREGRVLSASGVVTAAIDVSDGLAADGGHLARASGVDLVLRTASLPIPPAVTRAAEAAGVDRVHWALSGGEDYELLFTCDPQRAPSLARAVAQDTGTPVTVIGEVRAAAGDPTVVCLDERGRPVDVSRPGWDHFAGGADE